MNNILAALANVATQGGRTIVTTLKELTNTLQALKKLTVSKSERRERRTTIVNFIVGLMVEPGTKITSAVLATTRNKAIKMIQP